ncbi:uncharacterized protein A4U43_C04F26510 [Asparagus officinalis]|uniref:Uncharacterized protein n=1 Tax=Asparagus officinalis TaxID=4686 RepID=A0A5P1F950_ASPOF|nr:uncharacterized protein A4U43_C04F26510 [Asparagus officinalis]
MGVSFDESVRPPTSRSEVSDVRAPSDLRLRKPVVLEAKVEAFHDVGALCHGGRRRDSSDYGGTLSVSFNFAKIFKDDLAQLVKAFRFRL